MRTDFRSEFKFAWLLAAMLPLAALAAAAPTRGTWVVEAGIRKFLVGRPASEAMKEARAAYARVPTNLVFKVDGSMSLDEVNARVFAPGTQVLFKRGGVWRGQLQPRCGIKGHPVVYGAYGEGAKPVIQPSYARNRVRDWKNVGPNLWRTETEAAADIGNVIFNGSTRPVCAFKQNKLDELKNDLDFWCDPKTFEVTLCSTENPAKRFGEIELCEKIHCIDQGHMHDVVYDGLALRYTAAHGIGGAEVSRVTVRNCDISYVGGGYLYYDYAARGVRYGNGIEFWANCEDILVISNRVWECWDAGLTNQSSQDGAVQKNVVWADNEVWNCEYSYEYWQQGARAKTENVRVERNRFRDAGKGWGHRQRWNPNAAHLMFYDTTAETKGFIVKDNLFLRSEDTLFRLFNDWRRALTLTNNTWVTGKGSLCRYHGRPTANLVYHYPDRLDRIHDDNLAEIESQGQGARVFASTELKEFLCFMSGAIREGDE